MGSQSPRQVHETRRRAVEPVEAGRYHPAPTRSGAPASTPEGTHSPMKLVRTVPRRSFAPVRAATCGLLCTALTLAPVEHVFAAGPAQPAEATPPAESAPEAAGPRGPKVEEGYVGILRFTGDKTGADELRTNIQTAFGEAGFTTKGVALDIAETAKKVKCRGSALDDDCLDRIGQWFNKKGKQNPPYIYLVWGSYGSAEAGERSQIVIHDVKNNKQVATLDATLAGDDLIIPLMLPRAAVTRVQHYIEPPPPPTQEEQEILASLDGGLTPEEVAAQNKALQDAEAGIDSEPTGPLDSSGVTADLKKDFKRFCRNEPRKKRTKKDDPKDVRPSCKAGPFFGYWQPRAWVALGLTAGGLAAMGILYGVGLAKRGSYNTANAALESSGLTPDNPATAADYTVLASDVATQGNQYRRFLTGGDVALAASVVLFGVLGIIIYQDRTEAKAFIRQEKALQGIRDVKFGPMFGKGTQGASFGFRF